MNTRHIAPALCCLALYITIPGSLGYGGIRRRAWGKVHMLRSGKRGDLPPLLGGGHIQEDQDLQALAGHHQNQPRQQNTLEPVLDLAGGAGKLFLLEQADPKTNPGGVHEVASWNLGENSHGFPEQRNSPLQSDMVREQRSRPNWGGFHMLRSGKRSLPLEIEADTRATGPGWEKRGGGLWNQGRPRWGGAHMLRSGRSDNAMAEMIENMNNGITENGNFIV